MLFHTLRTRWREVVNHSDGGVTIARKLQDGLRPFQILFESALGPTPCHDSFIRV